MSDFLSYTIHGEPFMLFSVSHLATLVLSGLSVLALYVLRNTLRKPFAEMGGRYCLAGLLLLTEATFQLWHVYTGSWSAAYTLPLQLCSISLLFCIAMLVRKSYRIYEFTYFLGLGGALQAMLTPELFYPFPHFRFFHFFLAHAAIILACLYMTWVAEFRPTIRSYWKALAVLNLLLPIVLIANRMTGGNYMFVSQKPANPSLLDYLGPYPWYILSLEGVAALLFFLLYLPFYAQTKTERNPSQSGAAV
ncbi:TIGR02206 family membrane protein [Brevibacillus borstelensis]|uniref:YwaF family protein n=1 Tax=Brevibacillus borstelensis TaxID=45462 RepID=UPI0030C49C8A